MTSNLTSSTPSLAAMTVWKKPPDGSLKCNCDVALFEGERVTGMGCVFRNN